VKLIYHREEPSGEFRLVVHLDEERVVADGDSRIGVEALNYLGQPLVPGDPDPDWTLEQTWGAQPPDDTEPPPLPDGVTRDEPYSPDFPRGKHGQPTKAAVAAYMQMQVDEATLAAREELARRTAAADQDTAAKAATVLKTEGLTID
jgi:hypothetical protein